MARLIKPQKHGDRWRIRPIDEHGCRRYYSYDTREEAMRALREFQHQFETNKSKFSRRGGTTAPRTFGDLCDYQLTYKTPLKRNRADDVSIINAHLRPALGNLKIHEVDLAAVDRYRIDRPNLKPKTLSNHLTLLISMLRMAREMNWVREIPEIKKPRIPKNASDYQFLRTNDEIKRFLYAAVTENRSTFMLFLTAISTGMRAGELAGLKRFDVDFDNRILTVQRSFTNPTKSEEIRRVPILNSLLQPLREWMLENPLEILFPNEQGRMHQPSSRVFQEVLHRVLDRAGFPRGTGKSKHYIRFHDLRHSFASHWMMGGGDIFKLQRILGHKSQDMTQRYSHLSPTAFQADYARLEFTPPDQTGKLIELPLTR